MRHFIGIFAAMFLGACSVADIVGSADTPQGNTVLNPDAVKTADGALEFYQGAVALNGDVAGEFAAISGLLTDELRANYADGTLGVGNPIDARSNAGDAQADNFRTLSELRGHARLARGVLAEYNPVAPPALTGNLYAIEGLADVMMADLICSGIPLSTINDNGTFTLVTGSTTTEVYDTAITLFDSALAASPDSARISNFARVGKGRALLALGRYTDAAAAVASVPTSYIYTAGGRLVFRQSTEGTSGGYVAIAGALLPVVSDSEGVRGLPYASSGDPRSAVDISASTTALLFPPYVARKYAADGTSSIVLASGIEARLIEAEADLRADGTRWLELLNTLRADSGLAFTRDTAASLPTTATPATVARARIDQLLVERGYWLFLTGHRQGDLRRIVRNDRRPQATIYPSGRYSTGGTYGSAVSLAIPDEERRQNPKYSGCFSTGA